MNVAKNLVRVVLAGVLTVLVGTPMLAVICSTYLFGLVCAQVGRKDVLDRMIAWNTRFAGNMAQVYWARQLLNLVRVRVATRGDVNWSASHVLCANHASIFDILALIAVIPPPFRFVAKRELLKWPIIGWALYPAGQIVINRSDRSGAVRKLEEEASRKIDGQVIFFVEGTRSRTGELLPFKKGAFYFSIEHGLPVLPTAITGSFGVLAKVPWWRLHPGRNIEIVFSKELDPPRVVGGDVRHDDVQQLLDATREQIAAALEERRAA